MKKCRFAAIFLALALALPAMAPSALAADPPEVTAGAALLMDAANDEVLYEKNANERMYPASITKVMTALLVLEAVDAGQLSLDQVITASNTYQSDLSPNGSSQNIRPEEQMSVRDLLYCLLVASANEAANILAEAVDGSVSRLCGAHEPPGPGAGLLGDQLLQRPRPARRQPLHHRPRHLSLRPPGHDQRHLPGHRLHPVLPGARHQPVRGAAVLQHQRPAGHLVLPRELHL